MSELNLYEDTHGDGCGCPADQTRLSGLRKVRPGSLILDDVTVADLVAALQEEGVGEVVMRCEAHKCDYGSGAPGCDVWLAARQGGANPKPCVVNQFSEYLVVRIDGETS